MCWPRFGRTLTLDDGRRLGFHGTVLCDTLRGNHVGLELGEGADRPVERARHFECVGDAEADEARIRGRVALQHRKERRASNRNVTNELQPDGQPAVGGIVVEIGAGKGVIENARIVEEDALRVEGTDRRKAVERFGKVRKDRRLGDGLETLELSRRVAVKLLHFEVDIAQRDHHRDKRRRDVDDKERHLQHADDTHKDHCDRLPQVVIERVLIRREAVEDAAHRRCVEETRRGTQYTGKHTVVHLARRTNHSHRHHP
mmetsp:Transcript_56472/g.91399  ORF Transcript_56472/g.91399 Transcript_56472/m.91399 type:complete len:258 (+) Transcript_56472:1794-2567(+)